MECDRRQFMGSVLSGAAQVLLPGPKSLDPRDYGLPLVLFGLPVVMVEELPWRAPGDVPTFAT